jgi:hypothetical protein
MTAKKTADANPELNENDLGKEQPSEPKLNENDLDKEQPSEPVVARVLVELRILDVTYQPNQLIEADASIIDKLEDDGQVCSDDAAVEYCKSIGAEVIVIETK